MILISQILQETSLFIAETAVNNLVYGSLGVSALVAGGIALVGAGIKTALASKGIKKKKKTEKEKQAELDAAVKNLEEHKFDNTFEDLEAQEYKIQQAQAPTLGSAISAGDPSQMQGLNKLGTAQGYNAKGYTGEGYDSTGYTAGQTGIAGLQRGSATGLTNTMNNLQVSTAASEMAAQEADQSLAASQDLAAQAGTGAGGATALAAAAAKSKAGISSDIDRQVKQNEMMRAQGESELQRAQLSQGNLASQFDLGQSQFNVGAVNQAAQFGASAANQAEQFGANARNQANRFSADATNQQRRFEAQAQNQFATTQFGADTAMEQFNIGAQNQFALTDTASQNQFLQTQFGADVGAEMYNAQAQTGANQWAAENQWKTDVTIGQGAAAQQNNQYSQLSDIAGIKGAQLKDASDKVAYQQAQIKAGWGGTIDAAGSMANTAFSDRRLKKNIQIIGQSNSGLNIYIFKYKNPNKHGFGLFQGVMSDEVLPEATYVNSDGFDIVDYNKIDVEFKQVII
jgi:hypothetical protein|tara:strand:+ start:25668 stop:27209 length:1542 start_codon:yes stop_codon:yes gene_type:complete